MPIYPVSNLGGKGLKKENMFSFHVSSWRGCSITGSLCEFLAPPRPPSFRVMECFQNWFPSL